MINKINFMINMIMVIMQSLTWHWSSSICDMITKIMFEITRSWSSFLWWSWRWSSNYNYMIIKSWKRMINHNNDQSWSVMIISHDDQSWPIKIMSWSIMNIWSTIKQARSSMIKHNNHNHVNNHDHVINIKMHDKTNHE